MGSRPVLYSLESEFFQDNLVSIRLVQNYENGAREERTWLHAFPRQRAVDLTVRIAVRYRLLALPIVDPDSLTPFPLFKTVQGGGFEPPLSGFHIDNVPHSDHYW